MTAPEVLPAELEHQRDQGRPFHMAWALALRITLDGLGLRHQEFWRQTFSHQRKVWEAAYTGAGRSKQFLASERDPSQRAHDTLAA